MPLGPYLWAPGRIPMGGPPRRGSAFPHLALEHPSDAAEGAEDRALVLFTANGQGLPNPSREPAEGERLEPDLAGARHARVEETLAAEDRRLDASHELDVVGVRGLERHETAGVHPKVLAGAELLLHDGASRMEKCEPIAFEALHDETFTAEEADSDLLLKRDADRDPLGGAQKRVLLADELSPHAMEIGGGNLS